MGTCGGLKVADKTSVAQLKSELEEGGEYQIKIRVICEG